ncbi:hypothetical protein WJX75_001852 [Coccomyxa subellipsoidea]|uniref:EamA domain-containing protein n=1 Tax=Coccomyxa subellipsoidea TaxID=248742 RepID=A0ABR2YP68_9CHLO
MPATTNVEGSPGNTKKRQSFHRSAQANDLPAADTGSTKDIESGQQNSKSSYNREFAASQSASSRAAGKPEPKLRAGKGLSDVAKGQLCLMCVAALWGSYGPAIRYIYSFKGPPSAEALTAVKAVLQAAILLVSSMMGEAWSVLRLPLHTVKSWMGNTTNNLALAGLELGLWNFLATSSQALGLEITSATRASFLIQARGDVCILVAAFFYSLATVRLSRLAANVSSLELATSKSLALAIISLGWVGISAAHHVASHESLVSLWEGYADPGAWLVLLWSALGPGALAAYLQTRGQSKVPAASAQIIFSSLPLWSAFFAALLLHGEKLGVLGWLGGLTILVAGMVASKK